MCFTYTRINLLLVVIFMLGFQVEAQLAKDSLNINKLIIPVLSEGSVEGFLVKPSGKQIIYTSQLWMSGKDQNDSLLVAANLYRTGGVDIVPGPISTDPNARSKYNHIWKINKTLVDSFSQGLFTGLVPPAIANWPAHGDTNFGESPYLAPFVDVNNDGIYNPLQDGDYPCFPGDQAVFFMFNDDTVHTYFGTDKLGVEVFGFIYGYQTNDFLDSVAFEVFTIHLKQKNLKELQVGIFSDFDLGNYTDDILGTFVDQNTIIAYNGDADDEGPFGFGKNPPSAGITILSGIQADIFDGIDNNCDGCVDGILDQNGNCVPESINGPYEHWKLTNSMSLHETSFTVSGVPSTANHINNYLNSIWLNGSPLVIDNPSGFMNVSNGDGYRPDSTGSPISYLFPGNSYDTSGAFFPNSAVNWFESPANASEKRMVATMGKKTNLNIGDVVQVKVAYFMARDTNTLNSYDAAYQMAVKINGFEDAVVGCSGAQVVNIPESKLDSGFTIYPNPANQYIEIVADDLANEGGFICSLNGQKLKHFRLDFSGHVQLDIHTLTPGMYLVQVGKHVNRLVKLQ